MSCVEKRHISHRMGSMLHHRFPNGFTDLFMDETDREVSTLTDRAFRSLCVGDDAVYNDDFLFGYSPYSCLKPLAGEPFKKNPHKESKKARQQNTDKSDVHLCKQKQQANISHMSSFLKVLSVAEEKNGGITDSNGESWDKSALRSIERELSEFSSDYHTSLTSRHHKTHQHHQSGCASSNKNGKDVSLSSGNLTKIKNGKSTVKLRKLNIKNFFLHSEFSPFQTWTDSNRYPFGQDNPVSDILSADNVPKWYDLPFYKELTEAHKTEILHTEEIQSCQKVGVEPPATKDPDTTSVPPPPKVLPKPAVPLDEKRCSSDGGNKTAAPWRRNGPRARSVIPAHQLRQPPQESNSKPIEENVLVVKKDVESLKVKAIEEVSSSASTPFSICQLMTPVIPSRQPTETSEILQGVLSPSVFDLLSRPHSEAKVTTEAPVKRETYKSLASSILFNLKDNRKRVKSRYSPHKFKSLELSEGGVQSPPSDNMTNPPSEGSSSGLSTPAKDRPIVSGPPVEHIVSPAKDDLTRHCNDKPLSDDYLMANLLQEKCDAGNRLLGEENSISPFAPSKNKSPMAKKQNYPSLNLYKKADPVDNDLKHLQVPPSHNTSADTDLTTDAKNREVSPNALPTNAVLSPSTLNVIKDYSPIVSPHILEKGGLSSGGETQPNFPEKAEWPVKDTRDFAVQLASQEDNTGGQTISKTNVIRAAKEAINAAKNKARSASHSDSNSKQIPDADIMKQKDRDQRVSKEPFESSRDSLVTNNNYCLSQNEVSGTALGSKNSNLKKEPPPVPKRNFAKSDLQLCLSLDKKQRNSIDRPSDAELVDVKPERPTNQPENIHRQCKSKQVFPSRQNNFIKHQRCTLTGEEQANECNESNLNVNAKMETNAKVKLVGDIGDSEHIFNDLQALKQLERARLGDHMLENAKNKLEVFKIDEETKAKNNLISRELRNIKRGMLSMRGNTSAKRKIFSEKEQSKQEVFAKVDSNVIVNKALLNDNYDKAKMALEEVISERERRRNKFPESGAVLPSEDNDESCETWLQEGKKANKDSMIRSRETKNNSISPLKEKNLKQRLGDSRVSQNQPRPAETYGLCSRLALPNVDTAANEQNLPIRAKSKDVIEKLADNHTHSCNSSLPGTAGHECRDSEEHLINGREDERLDAPPVPPRSKKGVSRRDGSAVSVKKLVGDRGKSENFAGGEEQLCGISTGPKIYINADAKKNLPSQQETSYKNRRDDAPNTAAMEITCGRVNNLEINTSPNRESTTESNPNTQETCRVKQKVPLKSNYLVEEEFSMTNNLKPEKEPSKITYEDTSIDAEELGEIPRNTVLPLLLIKGVSDAQSPPDQASLSSKSSYFSVESTQHRTTENESNVFHSLGNSPAEVEQVNKPGQSLSQRDYNATGVEYSCLSDHESELEGIKQQVKSTQNQPEQQSMGSTDKNNIATYERTTNVESNSTTSSSSTFSPTMGIPALFQVKDNSFNSKNKNPKQPWSPRGIFNGSEKIGKELNQTKENHELSPVDDTSAKNSTITLVEVFKPKEISESESPQFFSVPSSLPNENPKTSQVGDFLVVPQEDERLSGVTPSSEGMESLPTSTADQTDDANPKVLVESETTNEVSEQSGFISSGNDSQTGLPKPPAVLPKSEKAVQKAIKLANRRMKKEESQKSSKKSSQSSSKHRAEKTRSDKSEQKSSGSAKTGRSSEKKLKDCSRHNANHHKNNSNPQHEFHNESHMQDKVESNHRTRSKIRDTVECSNQRTDEQANLAPERQGRSTDRHAREKPDHRDYSSDSLISNVPVYKAHVSERPISDRPFNRSQSIDRYLGGKVERRLSADLPVSEKLESRTQRIENSIMHELQQRGRSTDKPNRSRPLRRSQSIDAYSTKVPPLSHQSSHANQFSRQSSMEHAVLTQAIPMTQRKLLQDPDSGQYFFVDLPVQVKTKTFFDPGTGSYVQLPVQPPDGGIPQAPHVEVLTSPLVVYHSFVPVPLSPMAQKASIQAAHVEPNRLEQQHMESRRQMHIKEGHQYLEPAYTQQELMLGEFLGTEDLDCPS